MVVGFAIGFASSLKERPMSELLTTLTTYEMLRMPHLRQCNYNLADDCFMTIGAVPFRYRRYAMIFHVTIQRP